MSHMLSKLAYKFNRILKKADLFISEEDVENKGLIKDCLQLIQLIRKALHPLDKNKKAMALIDLRDIEDAIRHHTLYAGNSAPTGYLEVLVDLITSLQSELMSMFVPKKYETEHKINKKDGFEVLDERVLEWVEDLFNTAQRLFNQEVIDTDTNDEQINPIRMVEQINLDSDEFDWSTSQPEMLDEEEHLSGAAFDNEQWVNHRGRKYRDGDEYHDNQESKNFYDDMEDDVIPNPAFIRNWKVKN